MWMFRTGSGLPRRRWGGAQSCCSVQELGFQLGICAAGLKYLRGKSYTREVKVGAVRLWDQTLPRSLGQNLYLSRLARLGRGL